MQKGNKGINIANHNELYQGTLATFFGIKNQQQFKGEFYMNRLNLKHKFLIGSLAMVFLVMVASTTAVYIVLGEQNKKVSYELLVNSINIARDDLSAKLKKTFKEATQLATMNDMGSRSKFIYEYKESDTEGITRTTYNDITNDIYQIMKGR